MKMQPVLLAAITLISTATPAFADPIVITGGAVVLGSPSGSSPPFGFTLTGNGTDIGGITYAEGLSFVNLGETVGLSNSVGVLSTFSSGPSTQLVDGQVFTDVVVGGILRFVAEPVTFTDRSAGVNAPFKMEGVISLFRQRPFEDPGERLLTTSVVGSGMASLNLYGGPEMFGVFSTAYLFSPVSATPTPEPGTLLLMGSAFAVGATRLRRRIR